MSTSCYEMPGFLPIDFYQDEWVKLNMLWTVSTPRFILRIFKFLGTELFMSASFLFFIFGFLFARFIQIFLVESFRNWSILTQLDLIGKIWYNWEYKVKINIFLV